MPAVAGPIGLVGSVSTSIIISSSARSVSNGRLQQTCAGIRKQLPTTPFALRAPTLLTDGPPSGEYELRG